MLEILDVGVVIGQKTRSGKSVIAFGRIDRNQINRYHRKISQITFEQMSTNQ